MANGAYAKTIKNICNGTGPFWTGSLWKVALVKTAYVVNLATHEFLSDVGAANIVATSAALTGVTVLDDGVFDANPALYTAPSGTTCSYEIVYNDVAGADTVKPILLYFDTLSGLPALPNGTNITQNWNTGADKLFRI